MRSPKTYDDINSVTGRDGYLLCQALAYAVIAIEALPVEWQEASNAEDMRRLLRVHTDDHNYRVHMLSALAHLEQREVTTINGKLVLGNHLHLGARFQG